MDPRRTDVSIVVIALNEADHIADCVAALLAQRTDATFEIVVVDDGSIDGTTTAVQSLEAPPGVVRCLRHETNLGRGRARRSGLDAAGGAAVGFVDADIIVPPDWIARLLGSMADASAVSGIAVPDGDVAVLARIFRLRPKIVPGSSTITGNNVIFDGGVLRAIEFPTTRLGEDFRLAERLRQGGHVLRTVDGVVVQHRERKSYRSALRWLFASGVDATALLTEFRRVRLPDLVAAVWALVSVAAIVLALVVSPWYLLGPVLLTCSIAAIHVATRFETNPSVTRWIAAMVANVPLMGAYLVGRVVGVVYRPEASHHSHHGLGGQDVS